MATTPHNPFSPEAIEAHRLRRAAEADSQTITAVEIHEGTPAQQAEALLASWLHTSPETFTDGLAALATLLTDHAGAVAAAPEELDLEAAYRTFDAAKSLEAAGKALAEPTRDRVVALVAPDGPSTRTNFATPSGLKFKVKYPPSGEYVKTKDLREQYPALVPELRAAGIMYRNSPSLTVYRDRPTKKAKK